MDCEDYRRVEQAVRYLDEHAPEQPSLDRVAGHLGLSRYHFQRLFRRWAGVSPKRYLQHLTAEAAKELLRASASVLETAYETGLSGPGRLHDLFVSVESVTPGQFKERGRGIEVRYGLHPTPFGECLLALSERGICDLRFLEVGERRRAVEELREAWRGPRLRPDPAACGKVVERVFGRPRDPGAGPLPVLLRGTNFQAKVWRALLHIPEGVAVSYRALAEWVGEPSAVRAVAGAVGRNPIAYLIPCHRVLRSSGEVGGYRWGVTRKRAILARETASRSLDGRRD